MAVKITIIADILLIYIATYTTSKKTNLKQEKTKRCGCVLKQPLKVYIYTSIRCLGVGMLTRTAEYCSANVLECFDNKLIINTIKCFDEVIVFVFLFPYCVVLFSHCHAPPPFPNESSKGGSFNATRCYFYQAQSMQAKLVTSKHSLGLLSTHDSIVGTTDREGFEYTRSS